VGRLTIVVHGPHDPSDLEWRSMLRDETMRGEPDDGRTLVVSYGGGPSGQQRAALGQQLGNKPKPACIMTGSAVVRAIANALSFFNRTMKVVSLTDSKQAYAFLGLSVQERNMADTVRRELEHELGVTPPPEER
jgi:hypothetical protein